MSSDHSFSIGQRWITDAEPELGLGMVSDLSERAVTIFYPAADTTRHYSIDNSPLTRVRFTVGDEISSRDDAKLQIEQVREDEGLVFYQGRLLGTDDPSVDDMLEWSETYLNDFTQLTDTRSRLFAGQFDTHAWFEHRQRAAQLAVDVARRPTYGFAGARITPVAHQLYIASEVASRFAPRALLADEVGLGKTIEACLIVHRQLLLGLASRVLVIVPDVLLHQWLVEWVRRFNLRFVLFDDELMGVLTGISQTVADDSQAPASDSPPETERGNPFESEQLILCGMELFENPQYAELALEAQWDMVVVDEAHHIAWSPNEPSAQYQFFSELARNSRGLLLLSATPEQSGHEGHFARLHLLDPERFADYATFVEQQGAFKSLSESVTELLDDQPVSAQTREWVQRSGLVVTEDELADHAKRVAVVGRLLDLHGTSRVFFRNTRANIEGFPDRLLHVDELELGAGAPPSMRAPVAADRISGDPRLKDLLELLQLLPDKILVICAHAETVIGIEKYLRERHGLSVAVFHEGMSIIERDRAAAFFADPESQARLLICSEIGSEGRNFQFLQHLYLFDLPTHPDLLEQRIGRLDRIGQMREIHIHIPWISHSESELLYRWYHESMNAFAKTNNIGAQVLASTESDLNKLLALPHPWSEGDQQSVEQFIQHSTNVAAKVHDQMRLGRDRLVELSSSGRGRGDELCDQVHHSDVDTTLSDFLFGVYDSLGIHYEPRDNGSWILRADAHNQLVEIPGIGTDGMTVSFNRHYVLANEDVEYLSWEHPHTRYVLDLLQTGQTGRCAAVAVRFGLLPEGTVLIETRHVFGVNTTRFAALAQHLDAIQSRLLLDEKGRDLTRLLSLDEFWTDREGINRRLATRIVNMKRDFIEASFDRALAVAKQHIEPLVDQQKQALVESLDAEVSRLKQMRAQYGSVTEEEISALQAHRADCLNQVEKGKVRLEAARMFVIRR